ncbi:MAG: TonB-dependent receptor, partial [Chloroflexi bacterium]|nr:TonB-dependent receptor [Chloroflexota bacterium]
AHSVYGGRLDPRAGFVYFVSPTLRLRGGLGRTSRAPSFGELFFPFCSNPALRPEQAWATDLGLEAAARPGLLVRVNGFYTDAQNLIIGGCNPQNIGSARVAGLSAEVVGRLSDRWSIMWNLTVSDGIDRTTGLSLLRVPPAQANLVLRHSAGGGIAISLLANFVSERPDLDFSTFPATRMTLQAYATIGLRVERMVRGVTIRVGVDNLLDAQYETLRGFPAPGRTYFVQLGGSF